MNPQANEQIQLSFRRPQAALVEMRLGNLSPMNHVDPPGSRGPQSPGQRGGSPRGYPFEEGWPLGKLTNAFRPTKDRRGDFGIAEVGRASLRLARDAGPYMYAFSIASDDAKPQYPFTPK